MIPNNTDLRPYVRDLNARWSKAFNSVLELEHLLKFDHPVDEERRIEEGVGRSVGDLFRRVRFALELLSATNTRIELEDGFKEFADNLAGIGPDEDGDLHSASLDFLGRYISMMDKLYPSMDETDQDRARVQLLEQILKNTPKILLDRNVKPAKEATVYQAVGSVLSLVFPDFTFRVNLPKPLKNYKPDFGIPELSAAVEYKFAVSEEEVKTALDGIFSDMHGYAGSPAWKVFYAVIYMTDHFFTREQIEAHATMAEGRQNWKILPVYGAGAKDPKKKREELSKKSVFAGPPKAPGNSTGRT